MAAASSRASVRAEASGAAKGSRGVSGEEPHPGTLSPGCVEGAAPSPFALLGVSPGATQSEIRKAFLREALRCHPDKLGSEASEQRTAEAALRSEKFVKLRAAFEALSVPAQREGLSIEHIKESALHKATVHLSETKTVEEGLCVFECRCGEELPLSVEEVREAQGGFVEACVSCGIEYTFVADRPPRATDSQDSP